MISGMPAFVSVMFPIERADVESRSESALAEMKANILWLIRDSIFEGIPQIVDLTISGYDGDPRELHEIPDVCDWARWVEERFPGLWYFLHLNSRIRLTGWCIGPFAPDETKTQQFRDRFDKSRIGWTVKSVVYGEELLLEHGATSELVDFYRNAIRTNSLAENGTASPSQAVIRILSNDTRQFIECANLHLDHIRQTSPQLGPFLDRFFTKDNLHKFAAFATEKMKLTQSDHNEHSAGITESPVYFIVCTLPTELNQARDWFARNHGGYTRLLKKLESGEGVRLLSDCKILCHIVYGWTESKGRWIRIAIVPFSSKLPDELVKTVVMPVEFLTAEERNMVFGTEADETTAILVFNYSAMDGSYGKQAFDAIYSSLHNSAGTCAFHDGDIFNSDVVRELAKQAKSVKPTEQNSPLSNLEAKFDFAAYAIAMWSDVPHNIPALHESLAAQHLPGYLGCLIFQGKYQPKDFIQLAFFQLHLSQAIVLQDGQVTTSKYGIGR